MAVPNTYRVLCDSADVIYLTRNWDDSFSVRIIEESGKRNVYIVLTQADIRLLNDAIHSDDDR